MGVRCLNINAYLSTLFDIYGQDTAIIPIIHLRIHQTHKSGCSISP